MVQGFSYRGAIFVYFSAEFMRGSTTFLYEIWDTEMEQSWAAEVAEHVELVGHRELIDLQRQRLKIASA